jgi:hypothetical protein
MDRSAETPCTGDDGGIVTIAVPCRADEPGLRVVLDDILAQCRTAPLSRARVIELLFCINGITPGAAARPVSALREGCAAHGIPLAEEWIAADDVPASAGARAPRYARALLTAAEGKAHAWNLLRQASTGDPVLVCDADVTFSAGAFARLHAGLGASPDMVLFSPKTDCRHGGSVLERILAEPYRLDFPNLSGQLYAMRPDRAPARMPEGLLEPERWLELEVGPQHVGRDPTARVYVRLTTTLRDFFRQRVRIEMAKIQLQDAYRHLLARSRPQPGFAALGALTFAQRCRLTAYVGLRSIAHARAWWLYHRGRRAGIWVQPRTTKYWPTDDRATSGLEHRPVSGPVVSGRAERTGIGD